MRGLRQRARRARGTARWRAHRRQGVAGDLEGATGEVPGKEEGAGAHQNGGWVLQLEGDQGVSWRWSIEEWSSSEGCSTEGSGWR
jgi:hypothetical protein